MLIKQYHIIVLSNFLLAYDKYTRTYNKNKIKASTYPGVFFLLDKTAINIGIEKNRKLLSKLDYPGNRLIAIETVVEVEKLIDNELTGTGLGRYIESSSIDVTAVYLIKEKELIEARIEDVVAQAYHVVKPIYSKYSELAPRSISILPVANGCQAKCAFCFSSASISRDQKQAKIDFDRVKYVLRKAKAEGAKRAVITGGGEPGMLSHNRLMKLIKMCREEYEKVVMITNGYFISTSPEPNNVMQALFESGLNVLSISRHHYDDQLSDSIMSLSVDIKKIADAYKKLKEIHPQFSLRLICVLQKGGIDTEDKIDRYIRWAMDLGVEQICFKELYVSSSTESMFYEQGANDWSYENQIPLKVLVNLAKRKAWSKVFSLPWGSPVYKIKKGNGYMQVAAYTEPSVSWEMENNLCRSWNLMADGRCYASLETLDSQVLIPN